MAKAKKKVVATWNPRAGRGTSRAGLGKIIASILAAPHETHAPETLEELDGVVRKIKSGYPDLHVVPGGDGTLHQYLNRLLADDDGAPVPPIFAPATGTMNLLATSVGNSHMDPIRLALRVRAKLDAGIPLDTVHRRLLKVNGRCGFIYGTGLTVNFLNEYYADKEQRGLKGAMRVVGQAFLKEVAALATFRKAKHDLLNPVYALIELGDQHDPPVAPYMTHTAIMASTVESIGFGINAFPDARSLPGAFMLRSTQLSFWGFMAAMPALWPGFPMPDTFDAVIPKVRIRYRSPTIATIDGELLEPSLVDVIESGPSLTFVIG